MLATCLFSFLLAWQAGLAELKTSSLLSLLATATRGSRPGRGLKVLLGTNVLYKEHLKWVAEQPPPTPAVLERHRQCELSGYCSLGKVQPFDGDVSTTQGLKDCLVARSFRRELILIGGWIFIHTFIHTTSLLR